MKEQVVINSGTGIGEIIFIVLLILKITGSIAMPWFWVITSFIWAPIFIIAILLIIMFFGIILLGLLQ